MNKPQRIEKMDLSLVLRVSKTDKENLAFEAQKRGVSVSTLVRQCLIENRILNPVNLV